MSSTHHQSDRQLIKLTPGGSILGKNLNGM